MVNCPSCGFEHAEATKFCSRCRLAFTSFNFLSFKFRDHLYWILRRANAGFFSGLVAWLFIPALSRVLSHSTTPQINLTATGFLGGAFLGTVDGMVEESTPKTVRGAVLGAWGGTIGGFIFSLVQPNLSPENMPWGIFLFWGIAGIFIGLISALWEAKTDKIVIGALSGLIGGGIGGALGYAIYAFLNQELKTDNWLLSRFYEAFSGGLLGLSLWFAIGTAERFVIFKRRIIEGRNNKHCDKCEAKNPLSSWYCGECGCVLQEAAQASKLNLPPYLTLARLRDMFNFLARLAATTGIIGGLTVFLIFITANPMMAIMAVIFVLTASYGFLVLFSAVSESLQIVLRK